MHPFTGQVTAWEVRFGTGGVRARFRNSLTRAPDGRLVYGNPRGTLQLISQEHTRRQPKEELGWRLPTDTNWEVRGPAPPCRACRSATSVLGTVLSVLHRLRAAGWLTGKILGN